MDREEERHQNNVKAQAGAKNYLLFEEEYEEMKRSVLILKEVGQVLKGEMLNQEDEDLHPADKIRQLLMRLAEFETVKVITEATGYDKRLDDLLDVHRRGLEHTEKSEERSVEANELLRRSTVSREELAKRFHEFQHQFGGLDRGIDAVLKLNETLEKISRTFEDYVRESKFQVLRKD